MENNKYSLSLINEEKFIFCRDLNKMQTDVYFKKCLTQNQQIFGYQKVSFNKKRPESECIRVVQYVKITVRIYFNFSAIKLSTDNLPLPPNISASAKPNTRIKYSIPSPACAPNQFMKKPCST